jgi:heme exporter protein C
MDKNSYKKILFAATTILMLAAIIVLFFYSPIPIKYGERGIGEDPHGNTIFLSTDAQWENYKLSFYTFYFHMPIAITAYIAFFFVLIFSILYIRDKQQKWDIKASASAQVGVIFAGLTLISGSIWAGVAWNSYWPPGNLRLQSSLILFLIYLGYLSIRQAIPEPEKRARLSSVFGIIGFITVPISIMSIRLWALGIEVEKNKFDHPDLFGPEGSITGNVIILPLLLNMTAFILMCISLIIYKIDNMTLEEELMATKIEKGV